MKYSSNILKLATVVTAQSLCTYKQELIRSMFNTNTPPAIVRLAPDHISQEYR